jgi:malonyl-CoA/methylmalonyl-CoA synthetase
MFDRYLNRPEATEKEFFTDPKTSKKWFKTGDCAVRDADDVYSIKGRLSADIIKKGGYKISALDIEGVLLTHPKVKEACVLAVPSEKYGDEIAALIVGDGNLTSAELQAYTGEKLSSYKVPRIWKILEEIPRNQMGKINKKHLVKEIFGKKVLELSCQNAFKTAFDEEVTKNEKFIVLFEGSINSATG